ncbi:unnamed protein product [Oikopleura dioica]|uniref:SET domain-containing protein n=1 Tax=Oikopleura dioica TaxID=34765 RepID=E4YWJ9_OIKDI|nr:unnamed protein product [Oikopleura dioica]CBY39963.1 unnamed protein product [Oikopleura dioica]
MLSQPSVVAELVAKARQDLPVTLNWKDWLWATAIISLGTRFFCADGLKVSIYKNYSWLETGTEFDRAALAPWFDMLNHRSDGEFQQNRVVFSQGQIANACYNITGLTKSNFDEKIILSRKIFSSKEFSDSFFDFEAPDKHLRYSRVVDFNKVKVLK